ncbi:hypothetical protein [Nonomuraea dietziae]|uniref:hypothetical protein n=1 Tax=Nonomuraea dietziae TaxID=65515 RepID=UPI0033C1CC46
MRATATTILLAAVLLSGCDYGPSAGNAPTTNASPTKTATAKLKQLALGDAATVEGEKGQPLRITPTGIYYYKGDPNHRAENGHLVAIAYKAEALEEADGIPAPISGRGFVWRGAGQTIQSFGASPPWVGRVNTPIDGQDVQPGEYQAYILTFDLPEKGGTLVYTGEGDKQTRWALPKASKGSGLKPVANALRAMGLS